MTSWPRRAHPRRCCLAAPRRCWQAARKARCERADRERVTAAVEGFARQGLRVLALARKLTTSAAQPPERDDAESGLCFLGLVTMQDPPRPAVARRRRPLPRRRHSHHRHHRRPSAHRSGDRRAGRHRRKGSPDRQCTGVRPPSRAGGPRHPRHRPRGDLRPCVTRDQAADRRGATQRRARGRDDRGRRQRRTRPAHRRHRCRDGPLRNRRRQGGVDDGAHRRQLRDDRRRDRGRTPGLRQRSQVRPVHLRPRHTGGHTVSSVRAQWRRDPAPSDRDAAPRLRRRNRDPALARARTRADRAGQHGSPATPPLGGRDPGPDAGARVAVPRRDGLRALACRLLLRPESCRLAGRGCRRRRAIPFTTPTSRPRR